LQKFDLAISLHLHFWPALSLAVDNQWGGPSSADKREWLAGAISNIFSSEPNFDQQDLEDFLLQVMSDEFEVGLEDESEQAVAAGIVKARKECAKGDFASVDALYERWQGKGRRTGGVQWTDNGEQADTDGDDDEGEDEENGDTEMGEADAPKLVQREKIEPEIDEEGFTKVVGKRKK